MMHDCIKCGVELDNTNWYPSCKKSNSYICNECSVEKNRLWKINNPEKAKANSTRAHRKNGNLPMDENKKCSAYLGVHIGEPVLSKTFKNVELMPYGHPGYDIICNHDKRIDIKISCLNKNGRWMFTIRHNTTADYFMCLAFDNREDLNPAHIWLLPGNKFNHLVMATISPSTIDKWSEYELPIDGVITCCDTMRGD